MLARSRARRENSDIKRDVELDGSRQRNPLQDQKQMQLVKVTAEGKSKKSLIFGMLRLYKVTTEGKNKKVIFGMLRLYCD